MIHFFRNGEKISEVECSQSLNLLAHAQINELETGSECGGHGRCGKDRVKVSTDDQKKINAPSFHETKLISEKDLKEGWRLACQSFPNEDHLEIAVHLREDL